MFELFSANFVEIIQMFFSRYHDVNLQPVKLRETYSQIKKEVIDTKIIRFFALNCDNDVNQIFMSQNDFDRIMLVTFPQRIVVPDSRRINQTGRTHTLFLPPNIRINITVETVPAHIGMFDLKGFTCTTHKSLFQGPFFSKHEPNINLNVSRLPTFMSGFTSLHQTGIVRATGITGFTGASDDPPVATGWTGWTMTGLQGFAIAEPLPSKPKEDTRKFKQITCSNCNGKGIIKLTHPSAECEDKCQNCNGTGKLKILRNIKLEFINDSTHLNSISETNRRTD
jgi:hypothetical protein